MIERSSPERYLFRRSQKQLSKPSSNTGSSSSGIEVRLKSLESRTSIHNRHLYSFQQPQVQGQSGQPFEQISNSASGSATTLLTSTSRSSSNNGRLKQLCKMNGFEERSRSIGDRILTEDGTSTTNVRCQQQKSMNGSEKRSKAMQVFVRVRPLNSKEETGKNQGKRSVRLIEERNIVVLNSDSKFTGINNPNKFSSPIESAVDRIEKHFEMNQVFSEESSNEFIFEQTMRKDIRTTLFQGFNCTCFVYGMTGAGKTFTMFGDICNYITMASPVKGLIMLSLSEIIATLHDKNATQENDTSATSTAQRPSSSSISSTLKMSYLEIYNEQIRDLLGEASSEYSDENLMVVEDPSRGVIVPELTEIVVTDEQQVLEFIRVGNTRRQMAATGQNEFSSRSHAILTFSIETTERQQELQQPAVALNQQLNHRENQGNNNNNENLDVNTTKVKVTSSKLCLVDLAGSERASVTENRGIRLQEGANINKSLLALGNCINILGDSTKKGAFVPYRDSKLTRLLKDSLGGNTQTYMIACISPASISAEETLNTLKYASRARRITKTVTQNQRTISEQAAVQAQNSMRYLTLIESMKNEIQTLKNQLSIKQAATATASTAAATSFNPSTMNSIQSLSSIQGQLQNVGQKKFFLSEKQNVNANNNRKFPQIIPNISQQQQQRQQQTVFSPRDPNFSPVSLGVNEEDKHSFLSDEIEDEAFTKHISTPSNKVARPISVAIKLLQDPLQQQQQQQFKSTRNEKNECTNEDSNNNNQALTIPLQQIWDDQESFSSSGKSVRISCANTSNNGSVILFKRSPSQLNFTKTTNALNNSQNHIKLSSNAQLLVANALQQQQQSLVSPSEYRRSTSQTDQPVNKVQEHQFKQVQQQLFLDSRAATERESERLTATDRMQILSVRFVKNLEENWEIQQSIFELRQLQADNEEMLTSKNVRLKQLKGKLIQWVHESEINEISQGVSQLEETMTSNAAILVRMQEALQRNEAQKKHLQEEMMNAFSTNAATDHVLKQLTHTCEMLRIEKTDLHHVNQEIKQQNTFIQTQFEQKVNQIKSMQQQIKDMQDQLDLKNSIIFQNQALLKQLIPSKEAVTNNQHPLNSAVTLTAASSLRSTSSQNSKNKKFYLEKQGYFDFKTKAHQQHQYIADMDQVQLVQSVASRTTSPPFLSAINQSHQPVSPSVRIQKLLPFSKSNEPNNPSSNLNVNNNNSNNQKNQLISIKPNSFASNKNNQLENNAQDQQQNCVQTKQKQSSITPENSSEHLPTHSSSSMIQSTMISSSARLSTIPNRNVTVAPPGKALTSSSIQVNKKVTQTHRERQPFNNKFNSSSNVMAYISQPLQSNSSIPSSGNQNKYPTNKYSYSMINPSTMMNAMHTPVAQQLPQKTELNREKISLTTTTSSGICGAGSSSHIQCSSQIPGVKSLGKIPNFSTIISKDSPPQKGGKEYQSELNTQFMNSYRISLNEDDIPTSGQFSSAVLEIGSNKLNSNKFPVTSTHDALDASVSEFLKTDEFPEYQTQNSCTSFTNFRAPYQYQPSSSFTNIPLMTSTLTQIPNSASVIHQQQTQSQLFESEKPSLVQLQQQQQQQHFSNLNNTYNNRPPISVNLTLKRNINQESIQSPPTSSSKININSVDDENTRKDHNIINSHSNDNPSISVHKIDLFREKKDLAKAASLDKVTKGKSTYQTTVNESQIRPTAYSNAQHTNLIKSLQHQNSKLPSKKSVGDTSSSCSIALATSTCINSSQSSKERTELPSQVRCASQLTTSVSSSSRIKPIGIQNVLLLKLEDQPRCQSVSPPHSGTSKISSGILEVIERQKQKQNEEHQRHLYLSTIAGDILNSAQQIVSSPTNSQLLISQSQPIKSAGTGTGTSLVLPASPSLNFTRSITSPYKYSPPVSAQQQQQQQYQYLSSQQQQQQQSQNQQQQFQGPTEQTSNQINSQQSQQQQPRVPFKTQISSINLKEDKQKIIYKPITLFPQQNLQH